MRRCNALSVPLGVIGGTGFTPEGLVEVTESRPRTPWGEPSGPLLGGRAGSREVVALQRHGAQRNVPPHRINYRANLWALREAGVRKVVAVAAVGGIADDTPPAAVVIPEQLIDYTYGRGHSYFEDDLDEVRHIDFTEPYSAALRGELLAAAGEAGVDAVPGGTYAATQGPRLETAAEVRRLARDGATLVGMTGMPEAALAREIGLDYACCAVVVNWAAGKRPGPIEMAEIETHLALGMRRVQALLAVWFRTAAP